MCIRDRLYYDNRTDLNFVRVNLHQFAVLFDVRIVRSNIHQTGNRFSGFGNRIRLEPFSNLIEQHNGCLLYTSVLMTDEPSKIAAVMKIARKTIGIANQNIVFALGVKFLVLVLGALRCV